MRGVSAAELSICSQWPLLGWWQKANGQRAGTVGLKSPALVRRWILHSQTSPVSPCVLGMGSCGSLHREWVLRALYPQQGSPGLSLGHAPALALRSQVHPVRWSTGCEPSSAHPHTSGQRHIWAATSPSCTPASPKSECCRDTGQAPRSRAAASPALQP